MVEFSWKKWLRVVGSPRRRKIRLDRMTQVEGLEQRTLLTAPVAGDDTFLIAEDGALNDTVATNDTDEDQDIATFDLVSGPSNAGSFTFNPDGTFSYTPLANFHGTDTFTYNITDQTPETSNTATVTITVTPATDLTVGNDFFLTPANTALANTVAGNDQTTSGGPIGYTILTEPAHGEVVFNSDGSFTYTPDADFNGLDTFTYTANDVDANESLSGSVTIKVGNNAPTATSANTSVNKNNALNGTLAGNDDDLDTQTFSAGAVTVQNGVLNIFPNGTYTYTPNAGFSGVDSFSFKVNDGTADSAEATITIDVINHVPTATPATATVDEDDQLTGQLTGTDSDNDPLTFVIGTVQPQNGQVLIQADGSYVYTPNENFNGTDSFSFRVTDGTDNSLEATVTITVSGLNDAPVATVGSFSTNRNNVLSNTLTATDADDDDLVFSQGLVTATNGVVVINADGTFTYTPNAGFDGVDMFSFKVNDGQVDSAEVLVTVTVINNAPVASDGAATIDEDAALSGSVTSLVTDEDGDPLTYTALTQPANGTLTLSPDGSFIYTPTANFNGTDSFTFQATDGVLTSTVRTYTITVTPVEDVFEVDFTTDPATVPADKTPVVLDPNASIGDEDTSINYANSRLTATITQNGGKADRLGVASGALTVKGKKITFQGVLVGKISGGKKGQPLVVNFTEVATEDAVTAVLRQLTLAATKKAAPGTRTITVEVVAGASVATGTLTANVG